MLQDDQFLERKRWDFDATPPEKHPLLLHYHPLELYRHQVIKQTDVVLATYLVGQHFSEDEKRRTFDYYDPLTTGDSSLSACVQSVMASEVGYADAAFDYFLDACAVDLLDLHGNTADGIHIASCGGTWLALVAGFGGLRDADGEVRFSPRLPARVGAPVLPRAGPRPADRGRHDHGRDDVPPDRRHGDPDRALRRAAAAAARPAREPARRGRRARRRLPLAA